MSKTSSEYGNPLQKFKLVFLGEQSGHYFTLSQFLILYYSLLWIYKISLGISYLSV